MRGLRFEKYHGLGNDFLVMLDPSGLPSGDVLDAELVAEVCDRRRGVGADGVIVAREPRRPGESDVRMELRNADGGLAETSGNGLRCLALALLDAGLVGGPEVVIETPAGTRRVFLQERSDEWSALLCAEMGTMVVGPEEAVPSAADIGEPIRRAFVARRVDAGNPHLVLLGPTLDGFDIVAVGKALEGERAGGQNVEAVARDARDRLRLLVWERGAGITDACGSGSCAGAAVARVMGEVGDRVEVENPGGVLVVDLAGDPARPSASLTGPATRVATIDIGPSQARVLD